MKEEQTRHREFVKQLEIEKRVKEELAEDTNTKVEALPDTLDCAKDIAMKSEFIKRIIEQ